MNIQVFSKFFQKVMDVVFPRDAVAEKLSMMNAKDFLRRVKRLPIQKNLNNGTCTLFSYKEPLIREAIWQLKYRHNLQVAELLAEVVYEELKEFFETYRHISGELPPLLIPIPLSKQRFKERGYNQVEILARELCKLSNKRYSNPLFELETKALQKIKHTSSQAKSVSRSARLKNLIGSFKARPDILSGRSVILFDDVTTTGATMTEAIKILEAAGAKQIIAITIAH